MVKRKNKPLAKDSWEEKYLLNLKNAEAVSWGDEDAFTRYSRHHHVYDKLWLGKMFSGLDTWDVSQHMPDKYPVMVKPRTNFFGLSKDCYIADEEADIEQTSGMIAQEFVKGQHYSTDYVLKDGKIIDSWTFIGHKNSYGDFTLWESSPFADPKVNQLVPRILPFYTGVCNFESIDGHIIEGHLRGSLQFYDICGGLLEQMPEYILKGSYNKTKYQKTYSKVLRTIYDGYPTVHGTIPTKPQGVSSIQLCYDTGVSLAKTDPGSFRKRYAVINGNNLLDVEKYAKVLRDTIYIRSVL